MFAAIIHCGWDFPFPMDSIKHPASGCVRRKGIWYTRKRKGIPSYRCYLPIDLDR